MNSAKTTPLGELIRKRRQDLGMTQRDLAKACGLTDSSVSLWESGKTRQIHPHTLKVLAKALKISEEDLETPWPDAIVGRQDEAVREDLAGTIAASLEPGRVEKRVELICDLVRDALTGRLTDSECETITTVLQAVRARR